MFEPADAMAGAFAADAPELSEISGPVKRSLRNAAIASIRSDGV
jgi:hypothetical protein